jgi:hypothetical protein
MRIALVSLAVVSLIGVGCFMSVSGGQSAVQAVAPGTPQTVPGTGGLTGTWALEAEGVDPETQAKFTTTEEWVFGQNGSNLTGYYEVRTQYTSADGNPFQCSNTPQMVQAARYQIHGGISSGMIRIFEDAVASSQDPCDRRQLAPGPSHAGKVVSDAEIQLDEGRRVLKRR